MNNGIYTLVQTSDSGNTASDDFLTIQVSPGKAYVRGYEIETIAPKYIDVPKPRTVETYAGSVTPVEVGNFATVDNLLDNLRFLQNKQERLINHIVKSN